MGYCLPSNFDLAKLDPTLLKNSKLSMLEIFFFAVFSYCTFKLAIKRMDKSIRL